jgi:hypothetical protein
MTNRLQETDRPRGSGGELRRVLDEWEFKHSPYRFGQKLRNAFMASGAFLIAMAAIMKLVNPATASRGFGFWLIMFMVIIGLLSLIIAALVHMGIKKFPKKSVR